METWSLFLGFHHCVKFRVMVSDRFRARVGIALGVMVMVRFRARISLVFNID